MNPNWNLVSLLCLASCDSDDTPQPPEPDRLGAFELTFESETGRVRVRNAAGVSARGLFGELEVEQDRHEGLGRPETIEVSTDPAKAGFGPPLCPEDELCGEIRLGSRYSKPIRNLTAKIDRITPPTGVDPSGETEPAPFMGLDHSRGLFVYREVIPPGATDSAAFTAPKPWGFLRRSSGDIHFLGSVYGDVLEPGCGSGFVDRGEECDFAATPEGCDAGICTDSCTCCTDCGPSCGDGVVDPGEACDPNASPSGCLLDSLCQSDCSCLPTAFCGNGELEPGESCDPPAGGCPVNWTCAPLLCLCVPIVVGL
ncbi:MAG: hypothetical protein HYV07_02395 [Deltaproteobacteria bacterium]|nr:hypothetical protein [Deltaproteobacteria bacterium]